MFKTLALVFFNVDVEQLFESLMSYILGYTNMNI